MASADPRFSSPNYSGEVGKGISAGAVVGSVVPAPSFRAIPLRAAVRARMIQGDPSWPLPPAPGSAPYEILRRRSALGGMGEVLSGARHQIESRRRAEGDPVERCVDAERLARFRREAEVLASLDHPHIAAIFGLEDARGVALVMELVEGETSPTVSPAARSRSMRRGHCAADRRGPRRRARARHHPPRSEAGQFKVRPTAR